MDVVRYLFRRFYGTDEFTASNINLLATGPLKFSIIERGYERALNSDDGKRTGKFLAKLIEYKTQRELLAAEGLAAVDTHVLDIIKEYSKRGFMHFRKSPRKSR